MGSDPGAIGSTPREQARAKDGSGREQVMRGHAPMAPPTSRRWSRNVSEGVFRRSARYVSNWTWLRRERTVVALDTDCLERSCDWTCNYRPD